MCMYMYVYVCACLCILHSCKKVKYSTHFSSPCLLLLNSKSWRSRHCSIVMYGEIPHSFIQMHSAPFIDTEQFIQSPRDGYLGGCSLLLPIVLQWIALCKYLFIVCGCILLLLFFLIYSFIHLFVCLFVFGCVGSSFLCEGFLQLRRAGAPLHRGARASHCRGLSCCGVHAPDAQAQQLWLTGLVALRHVGSSQTRAQTHVPCIGMQILNQCTIREALAGVSLGKIPRSRLPG